MLMGVRRRMGRCATSGCGPCSSVLGMYPLAPGATLFSNAVIPYITMCSLRPAVAIQLGSSVGQSLGVNPPTSDFEPILPCIWARGEESSKF